MAVNFGGPMESWFWWEMEVKLMYTQSLMKLTDDGKTLSAEPQLLCNFMSKADGGALDRIG